MALVADAEKSARNKMRRLAVSTGDAASMVRAVDDSRKSCPNERRDFRNLNIGVRAERKVRL